MYSIFDFCEHEPKCRPIKETSKCVKICSQLQPVRETVLVLYFFGAHAPKENIKAFFYFLLGTILLPGGEKSRPANFAKFRGSHE